MSFSIGQDTEICAYKLQIDGIENLDIYTLLIDHQEVLYLGTDQGLFCYKSSQLHSILPAKNQKGLSIFQLQMDAEGKVYCCNLSGQIFRVANNELEIVYEVPQENIKSTFLFHVLEDEAIVYAAKNVALVKNGVETELMSSGGANEGYEWLNFQKQSDGSLFLSRIGSHYGLRIRHEKVDTIHLPFDFESNKYPTISSYLWNNQEYYFTTYGQFASSGSSNFEIASITAEKYHKVNDSIIIALDRTSGGRLINLGETVAELGNLLPNKFISTSYFDGNTLYLGTFNQGIYVCPNLNALKHAEVENAIGLNAIGATKVVVATTGEVYYIKDSIEMIDHSSINLDAVFSQEVVKSADSILYNKENVFYGHGVIKDVWEVEEGVYFTSNMGLFYLCEGIAEASSKGNITQHDGFYVVNLGGNHRYHSVAAVSSDAKDLLYSDAQGTYLLNGDKPNGELLLFEGEHFISNDLERFNEKWICATAHHGILFFEGNKCIDQLNVEDGLNSNSIQKIQRDGESLYIQTIKGVQVIHLEDLEIRQIGLNAGIGAEVRDFDLEDGLIWLLQGDHLVSLPTINFNNEEKVPQLYIDSVVIGGKLFAEMNEELKLTHTQNTLSVYYDFRDLIASENAKVLYQLKGLETTWKESAVAESPIEYSSLPPGSYTFLMKVVVNGNESEEYKLTFAIDAPYYQKWWFYVLITLGAGLLVFIFVRIYMIRENKRLAQQNELNASKLTAIQSQMNPHFIFNALNSIQDLVLKGDKKNSYTYITKFANLVRRTLNYSDKDLIELNQEVKLIELYLTLEKLRFKADFEYDLSYPESEVLVPPMLVQPFIENALVHGLLHKEGLRKLHIRFELKDQLICTITDNGVGRKKASEIKERQRGKEHESFSVNAIRKRFEILSEYYGGEFGYVYHDLEKDGEATGTKVVLILPAIRKY